MTSTHFFSSLFRGSAQANPTQPPFYSTPGKRKRDDIEDSADEHALTDHAISSEQRFPPLRPQSPSMGEFPSLLYIDSIKEQFPHYPHQPLLSFEKSYAPWELTRELANLKPPLPLSARLPSSTPPEREHSSLKQRHVGVLTAMLHKCLYRGDYIRAGRVWGMLLRAEVNGEPMDIRTNGMWGLGAELLLQRDVQQRRIRSTGSQNLDVMVASGNNAGLSDSNAERFHFTYEGFEMAKAYYERLILQYPSRKWLPDSLSSLHFYPMMFGLWISHVQDQHLSTLDRLLQAPANRSDGDSGSEDNESQADLNNRENTRQLTLQSAGIIEKRLDELLHSFPYSDSTTLRSLRGMVALWIGDLSVISTNPNEKGGEAVSGESSPEPLPQ